MLESSAADLAMLRLRAADLSSTSFDMADVLRAERGRHSASPGALMGNRDHVCAIYASRRASNLFIHQSALSAATPPTRQPASPPARWPPSTQVYHSPTH